MKRNGKFPSSEQKRLPAWFMDNPCRVCVLTGYAGTGKTKTLGLLNQCINGKTVWCSPSHQAASVLSNSAGVNAITLASALGLGRKILEGKEAFVPVYRNKIDGAKYLIIDEASMISKYHLSLILKHDSCKILFVGDPAQLPPVKEIESPVFAQFYPTHKLTTIFRSGEKIINFANDIRESHLNKFSEFGINTSTIQNFYEKHNNGIAVCPTHAQKELCNNIAKQVLGENNSMFILESSVNPPNGPSNGSVVRIVNKSKPELYMGFTVVRMDIETRFGDEYQIITPANVQERKEVSKELKKLEMEYKNARTGDARKKEINRTVDAITSSIIFGTESHAMTIHKAQGSGFDHVLFCTAGMNFFDENIRWRMAYTAVTRAAKELYLCL